MALGYDWTNIANTDYWLNGAHVIFWIDVKLNRQDLINNYSVVDTRLTSTFEGNYMRGYNYKFTLTGANDLQGSGLWTFDNETIITGQTTIYHNDDGTKNATFYASAYCGGIGLSKNFNGNIDLPTIARASTPTVSPNPFNIGDTITINTNRASTQFTHTMTLNFGSYSYSLGNDITDTITLDTSTIANNLYQQTPNDASKNGTINCITYNGETTIGTKDGTFTAKVSNATPTGSVDYEDTNATTLAITSNSHQIIRNNSTLQINLTNASAKKYATLSSLSAVINGTTYPGTLNGTTGTISVGTLNLSSNINASVRLTDSRGITASLPFKITILDWVLPTGIISCGRQNNFYSETDVKVDASYSSLDSKNVLTLKVRSKKTTEQSYGAYTTLTDNTTTTLILDNNYAWDIQFLVQDLIGSTTYNTSIDRGIPIVFFDRRKRSVGIDCFPTEDTSLEVNGKIIGDTIVGDNNGTPMNLVSAINTNISDITELKKNIYSTTEVDTGMKWIDDKPIYRIVIQDALSGGGWKFISTGITTIDTVVKLEGKTVISNTTEPIPMYENGNNWLGISFNVSNGNLQVGASTNYGSNSFFAIIEYTKTTD